MAFSSTRFGSADDRLRLVREQINLIPGSKKDMGNKIMICCPYHNDTSPSATISLDPMERDVPVGFFGCFSPACGKNVSWNTLARTLGLKTMGKPKNLETSHFAEPETFKEELFKGTSSSAKFPDLELLKFKNSFPFKTWRDVDVSLLEKVGARYVIHEEWNMPFVWLPVNVNGKLRGYVNAKVEKPTDDKPSYLNAKASNGVNWSRKWGLIYFDYAIKLMRKRGLKTIALCEGPRDSLRYLKRKIPAVSVLGAKNWSAAKRELLEDAGVEKIIISFDGDDAGLMATKAVYKDVRHYFDTKYLALWKHRTPRLDKHGDQMKKEIREGVYKLLWDNEMDPFNCPSFFIDAVEGELE